MNNLIEEFIRDITKVHPMSKSEARKRLEEVLQEAVEKTNLEWTNKLNLHSFLKHYGGELDAVQKLVNEAHQEAVERVIESIPVTNEWDQLMFISYTDPRDGTEIVRTLIDIKRELRVKHLKKENE